VQRDEVWDHVRMAYLLDSLLSGYPIGSLLVCKATGQTRVIKLGASERTVEEADAETWQLLDGQQRINALFSIFTGTGQYGRFYLHMTSPRVPAGGPVTSRRSKKQSLKHIQWQDEPANGKSIADRDRYIDLSRWYEWTKSTHAAMATQDARLTNRDETLAILNAIDPDFADDLAPGDLDTAWQRLRRLLEIWQEPSIPVQYVSLGSPNDVLEIFTRVNRAGVQVAGQDLFFAAVKTFWSDAEQVLARVAKQLASSGQVSDTRAHIIDRLEALRVLGRLAARATNQGDLVPLTVDRLSGDRGSAVIQAMREMAADGSAPLRRMAATLNVIAQSSRLGFGLYSVDSRLWDTVLGWAAVNAAVEEESWLRGSLDAIDAYLFGATVFHYPAILRDPFSRLAFNEALVAGTEREPFPTQRIAEVARTQFPGLREGRQRIRGSRAEVDRLWLADSNTALVLSIFQSIPYMPQRDVFDWDHIFPSAQAGLMWSPGPSNRRRHHRDRHLVGSTGNLWGLDAGLNRAAQDKLPRAKFQLIESEAAKESASIWPRDRWGLDEKEVEEFSAIGDELGIKEGARINAAMERFRNVITARARRMVDAAFRQLPAAEMFASDSGLAAGDPRQPPSIVKQLEIESPIDVAAAPGTDTHDGMMSLDERTERIFRLADDRGSGPAIRAFARVAISLNLQIRPYRWTLTITPPKTKALALIALTPNERERGIVETWVAPAAFAAHFPQIAAERFEEALRGIRGAPFDQAQLHALSERLQRLLGHPAARRNP
jgi:hypothetical protein